MATPYEEQLSVNARNEVFARHAAPGIGKEGSTPETDATGMATAAAMERSDRGNRFGFGAQEYLQNTDNPAALRASRDTGSLIDQALEGRRTMLAQGIDPDRPAIAPDRKRRTEMMQESVALSHVAHQSFEDRQNLNAINETGALHNELANPPKGIKIGTPEYGNWVYGLATKYPNGAMTGAGMRSLERVAGLHDRAAAMTGRPSVDLTVPEGFQVDHYVEDTKGNRRAVLKPIKDVAAKDNTDLSKELFKAYKVTPGEITAVDLSKIKAGTGSKTDFKPDPNGNIFEVPTVQGNKYMPASEFHRFYDAFSPKKATTAQPGAQTQPTGTIAAQTSAPKEGESKSGYRFKGGNPADRNNWEKVK